MCLLKAGIRCSWWTREEGYVGSFGSAVWSSKGFGGRRERCGGGWRRGVDVDAVAEGVEGIQRITTAVIHLME